MPIYHLTALDIDNGFALRAETRAKHLEYLTALGTDLLMAGPILNNEEKPIGTIAIFVAENATAAQETTAKDPYRIAGLFKSVKIEKLNPLFGKWCG